MIRDARILLAAAWRISRHGVTQQLVLLLLSGLVGGASLLLLIPIVNSIADAGARVDVPVIGSVRLGDLPIGILLAIFVALIAVQALLSYASTVTTTRTQQGLVDRLREEAFAAVLSARWSFLLQQRRSDIVAVISVGASRAGVAYSQLLQAAIAAMLALVTASVALIVSPAIAATAIVGVVVLSLVLSATIRPAYRLGHELGGRQREMQAVITDSLDSLRLIRAHAASAIWIERLSEAFSGTRDTQLSNARRQSRVSGLTTVGTAVASALLVLVAVALNIPATDLVLILLLVVRLSQHARSLVTSLANLANAVPAVRDLGDLTAAADAEAEFEHSPGEDRGPLDSNPHVPLLSFEHVTFDYPEAGGGVSDLTLQIERGRLTVLTGPSGAGKSTTVDLALGLLSPHSGRVTVDGTTLTTSALEWWRTHIAYVPQETLLIPGSVRDNLAWSLAETVSDEQCWDALAQASAGFARAWSAGLDTELGDRGVRLSGGERQRIALARALLRRPSLLVLDEATNALDEDTEAEVLDVLRALTPRITVLVVAHRRATIDAADCVIRLG